MTAVAEIALELGLEVWFSPAFFEHSLEEPRPDWSQQPRRQHRFAQPSGACGLRRRQRAHALRTRLVVGKSVT